MHGETVKFTVVSYLHVDCNT